MSKERPLRGEELDRIEQGSFSGLVIANREGAPPLTLFIFAQMFRRLQQKIVNVRREESQRREDMFEAWSLQTVWGPDFTEEAPSMLCLCGHRTLDHEAWDVGGTPTYYRGPCKVEGCKCPQCKITTTTYVRANAEMKAALP